MDDTARAEYEKELAAAIVLLWIIFDSSSKTRVMDYATFLAAFNEHVRPILTRVYGNARNDLASRFGYAYPSRQAPGLSGSGGGTVIQIPNLNRSIDQYAEDFYSRFVARHSNWEQTPKEQRPKRPQFTESDAETYAVTNVTGAKSNGEHDAARDVESRIGTRLVPMWKTEPGACPICRPLEGKGPYAWRSRFPNGPPAHPNCRCDLAWRPLIGDAPA